MQDHPGYRIFSDIVYGYLPEGTGSCASTYPVSGTGWKSTLAPEQSKRTVNVQISQRIGAGDWFCQHILPPDPDCRVRLHTVKSVMEKSGKGGSCRGDQGMRVVLPAVHRRERDSLTCTIRLECLRWDLRCIPPSWGENGFAVAPPAGQGSPGDRILNALSRSLFT